MNISQSITQRRRDNLNRILSEEFSGNRQHLADAINYTTASLSQWLSDTTSSRPISDTVARRIENRLTLDNGFLDKAAKKSAETYYVMMSVEGRQIQNFITYLSSLDTVQEVSALFGEKDVFAKIELHEDEFQDFLMEGIYPFPGVKSTTTFKSLANMRCQKEQAESSLHYVQQQDYVQQYLLARNSFYFNQMKNDDGQVVIAGSDPYPFDMTEYLSQATQTVCSLRKWSIKQSKIMQKQLLDEISQLPAAVSAQHLIMVDEMEHQRFKAIEADLLKLKKPLVQLRVMQAKDWQGHVCLKSSQALTIADGHVAITHHSDKYIVRYQEDKVKPYVQAFKQNWNSAVAHNAKAAKAELTDAI